MTLSWFLLVSCLTCAPAFAQAGKSGPIQAEAPPALWKPVVGQPAPDIACNTWIDIVVPEKGTAVEASASKKPDLGPPPKPRKTFDLQDSVIIVHTFAFDDAAAKDKLLPLVRDLLVANTDRKLAAIGIAKKVDLESARTDAKTLGLDYPIALEDFAKSSSPYVDPAHSSTWVYVVGRGGGLLWQGNPTEEKPFLDALKRALDLPQVARIDRKLNERLVKALADYYAGRVAKADSAAEDEIKAGQKVLDMQRVDDGMRLDKAVGETQTAWLRNMGEAARNKDATTYAALMRACKNGLTKSDMQKEFEKLEKDAHKDGAFESRLLDAHKFLNMLDERPALFPARKDAASDKFAGKLEAFVTATPNPTDDSRTARSLADRYRLSAH